MYISTSLFLLLSFVLFCVKASSLFVERNSTKANDSVLDLQTLLENDTNVDELPQQISLQKETEKESEKQDSNDTDTFKSYKRITPIMFINIYSGNKSESDVCSNSEEDFPSFFTHEQRLRGGVLIAFLVGIYCFTLLAVICDKYFLPCVERICEALNLTQDVAAATFMAMATSAPELFVNIIGTFITQSDIGIGTVVGSSMFNTLGVAALGSLAATSPIQVDWWPVTRDCTIYIVAISMLVFMTWDGYIYWYEGMILFIVYFIYFVIMFNNERISKCVRTRIEMCWSRNKETTSTDDLTKCEKSDCTINEPRNSVIFYIEEPRSCYSEFHECEKVKHEEKKKDSEFKTLFKRPAGCMATVRFLLTWPIKLLLFCTIPNPKTKPKLFPMTFIICIIYIGVNSYIVSWMITIIGHTFQISDAVLGLTFLAAGGCLPEAISVIILSRKGEGRMGVSNALGANTMNILLSLGLPWFIKTMIIGGGEVDKKFIQIESGSIEYTILALCLVAAALFLTLYLNKFRLQKRTGIILLTVYFIFLCLSISSEILFVQSQNC